ncbi:MAG: 30S ribosomal protein S20 [Patescibacteria group bacterium]
MPITSSAKKALRASSRKHVFNVRRKDAMREVMKKAKAIIAEGNKTEAIKFFPEIQKVLDKAVKRGVIPKNTASRKKARIVAAIEKIS